MSLSWNGSYRPEHEPLFDQMALQGQSFINASGDGGSWSTTYGPQGLGDDFEQAITIVGGTELLLGGTEPKYYEGEGSWPGSGGGIMSNTSTGGLPIPWYQYGAALASHTLSGASTTYRNAPDVSAVARCVEFVSGGVTSNTGGTSFAAPIWAGFLTDANAASAAEGYPTVGFANPVLYGLASGPSYTSGTLYNDVQSAYEGCSTYCPSEGYDLVTGLGSMGTDLMTGIVGATGWTWTVQSVSGIPSAITSFAASPPGNSVLAWAIDNTPWSGTSPDHQVWKLKSSGWSQIPGVGAIQISVSPDSGYPWTINHNGTTFYSANGGGTWTVASANATAMSWVAAGPSCEYSGPTAWGISKTASNGDYLVWNYNVLAQNTWEQTLGTVAGLRIAVSPDTGTPWLLNHNGTLLSGESCAGVLWTPVTDVQDGGTFYGWSGTGISIGAGPRNQLWLINNQPWVLNSLDNKIFALLSYNSITDAAWVEEPGGALQVSVSAGGTPWVINHGGTVFYGGPGWHGGGNLEHNGPDAGWPNGP